MLRPKSGGRYISLERIVEESKDTCYEALRKSSEGWHHNGATNATVGTITVPTTEKISNLSPEFRHS